MVAAAPGIILPLLAFLSAAAADGVVGSDVISNDDMKFLSQWTNVDVDTLRTYEMRAGGYRWLFEFVEPTLSPITQEIGLKKLRCPKLSFL